MRNILTALLIISIIFLASCGSKEETEAEKKFGKLKVEIPNELKGKPEVVEYINETAKLTDEYALLIDEAVDELSEFKGMKEEDLGMLDNVKIKKVAAKLGFKSLEIMGKWAECTEKRITFEKKLSEPEIEAFDKVFKRFEKRMKQVEEKHADFFKDKD